MRGIIILIVTLLLDQISKWYIVDSIHHPIYVTSFFNLVMVWNSGISFGMFQDIVSGKIIFSVISISILIFLLLWLRKTDILLQIWAIGLISGGAIGNVIDRIRFGAVIDFLDFHVMGYHWPAFNVADATVFVGAVMLSIDAMGLLQDKET